MSAGGLSYSGLVNHGKITLPSVDSWGTNMNILRDPPKSITTRRIEKVGQTSSITDMIDESGTRACEAIQVYARGVNPFVSVSYNNYGNNGGQNSSGIRDGGMQSAKLPYRIMQDGAFRPPILLQEDLLPLSRIPRGKTSAFSQAGFADFSRKMRTCGTAEETKEVKTDTLKGCVRPTAVYQIETPLNKPFEVKYVIQPFIKRSVGSGMRSMDITHKHGGKPTKEIDNNPLHARAQANFTEVRHVNNNQFYPERYLQNPLSHSVASNISSNKYSNLENNELHPDRYLQDPLGYSVASNISSNKYSNLDNNELHPDRYLQDPLGYSVASNISSNKYSNLENNELHPDRYLQDHLDYSVASNISSNKYSNLDNNELNPDRYLQDPLGYSVASNISSNKYSNLDNNELHPDRYLQDHLDYSVASNISSNKYSNLDNNELHPDRYLQEHLDYSVASNISSNKYSNLENNELQPERYLQNHLNHSVASNISSNRHYTSIEDILDLSDMPIHNDIRHSSIIAPVSGVEKTKYFHDDISLSRNLPEYNVTTNIGNQNVHKRLEYDKDIQLSRKTPVTSFVSNPVSRGFTDHSSRDARLAEKINLGGYSVPGQIPMQGRMQNVIETKESEKGKLGRMVIESMQQRFDKPAPFS